MSLKDWNHFIRPNIWAFGLAVFLVGVLASGSFVLSGFIVGGVVSILLCTASITVNHYFDYNTDKKSRQLYRFPVASEKISKKVAAAFSFLIILLSVLLSYFFMGQNSFYLTLFANFMVVSYSAPPSSWRAGNRHKLLSRFPVRIKERPFLETFWNGVGYGWIPYYLALFISGQPITHLHHLLGLIPFLVSASGHILLQIRDIKDDKKGKVRTTATKLGMGKMKKISGAMVLISGLLIIYLTLQNFLNYLAFLSIIFGALVWLEHKKMKPDVTKSYKKLQILYIVGGLFFLLSILRL